MDNGKRQLYVSLCVCDKLPWLQELIDFTLREAELPPGRVRPSLKVLQPALALDLSQAKTGAVGR